MSGTPHPARLVAVLALAAGLTAALTACSGPTAREVQEENRAEAETAQADLEDALGGVEHVGTRLGSTVRDSCETGQHNWKVDDDYDVLCTVEVRTAFHVTGEDFRAAADAVTGTFPGCDSGETDAEQTLRDYWDELEGESTQNFEGPYRPDYLPGYRLGCAGGSVPDPEYAVTGWVSLPVDEESAALHEDELGPSCTGPGSDQSPCLGSGDTAQEAWERAASDQGWVVFVSGITEYARTG